MVYPSPVRLAAKSLIIVFPDGISATSSPASHRLNYKSKYLSKGATAAVVPVIVNVAFAVAFRKYWASEYYVTTINYRTIRTIARKMSGIMISIADPMYPRL